MTTVVSEINLIKLNDLNHDQFQQSVAGGELEYGSIKYFFDVCWLSKTDLLRYAYKLLNETKIVLGNEEWNCVSLMMVNGNMIL
jgi:hypothetical protein